MSDYPINETNQRVFQSLQKEFAGQDFSSIKILDNGCDGARAELAPRLLNAGFRVIGSEIIWRELYEKQNKFSGNKNLKLVCADSQRLPFRGNSFDAIAMVEVLEHLEDSSIALADCYHVLKDKGTIILSTPNVFGLWSILTDKVLFFFRKVIRFFLMKKGPFKNPTGHVSLYGLESLKRALKNNNLEVEWIFSSGLGLSSLGKGIFTKLGYSSEKIMTNLILRKIDLWIVSLDKILSRFVPLNLHSGWIVVCRKDHSARSVII